tara:strand:- start:3745 stop:3966 length:222 start_codon:yes stop_codon:yes gene_type:complete
VKLLILDSWALKCDAPYSHLVHVFLMIILNLVAIQITYAPVAHLVAEPALATVGLIASNPIVVVLLALDKLAQ